MHVNLHPINFVILSGILQSIILACILLFTKKGNRQANRLISLLIIICGLHFSWTLIIDTNFDILFNKIFWFPYSYLLAVGPLLFLYTRLLTSPKIRLNIKDTIHFLPALIEVSIQVFLITSSIRQRLLIYDVPGFMIFRLIEYAASAISIIHYSKQSLARIKTHETWLKENFSSTKDVTLAWLHSLIKYLRVLWIAWFAFELSFFLFWQFQAHLNAVYALLYLLLGTITYSIYWIAIQTFTKSESLSAYNPPPTQPPTPSVYARLTDVEIKTTIDALSHLMQTEKLYLHDTLTLRTLATRLQKDPNLVSHILNTHLHKSFHDYINEHRITAVIERLQNPAYAHLKIVEIAYDCGFNSKATFNRVFKTFTGKSPSSYLISATSHNHQKNQSRESQ